MHSFSIKLKASTLIYVTEKLILSMISVKKNDIHFCAFNQMNLSFNIALKFLKSKLALKTCWAMNFWKRDDTDFYGQPIHQARITLFIIRCNLASLNRLIYFQFMYYIWSALDWKTQISIKNEIQSAYIVVLFLFIAWSWTIRTRFPFSKFLNRTYFWISIKG